MFNTSSFSAVWQVGGRKALQILHSTKTQSCLLQYYLHDNFMEAYDFLRILSSTTLGKTSKQTSQELRMLSSVTLDCQVTNIVMNSGSQL